MKRPQDSDLFFSHTFYFIGRTLLLVLLFSGLFGCKSSKDIVKNPAPSDVKLLEQLIFVNGNFESMDSRVEFKFMPKEGISAGVKGFLKMRRDSCLILSVQPFAGIEAVRCLIKKDSLFIMSRIHQTYSAEDLSRGKFSKYLNLELLQALLSNRIFIPGEAKPDAKDLNKFEWHKQKEGDYFRWVKDSFKLDFFLNDARQYSQFKASGSEYKETISVLYSLFQVVPTGTFPYRLEFRTEGIENSFHLQITYLKPNFDSPTDFRFEIPSKYKKVTMAELVKRFQKML